MLARRLLPFSPYLLIPQSMRGFFQSPYHGLPIPWYSAKTTRFVLHASREPPSSSSKQQHIAGTNAEQSAHRERHRSLALVGNFGSFLRLVSAPFLSCLPDFRSSLSLFCV